MGLQKKELTELIESIKIICEKAIQEQNISYFKDGLIKAVNTDGTVNVEIDEVIYNNIKVRSGLVVEVGKVVDVLIRNGNFNDKRVIDKY